MIGRAIIHTHGGWGEVLVRSDLIYSVLVVSRRRRRPPFPWGGMEVHGSVEEEEKSSSSSSSSSTWAWAWCKSKAEAKGVGGGRYWQDFRRSSSSCGQGRHRHSRPSWVRPTTPAVSRDRIRRRGEEEEG